MLDNSTNVAETQSKEEYEAQLLAKIAELEQKNTIAERKAFYSSIGMSADMAGTIAEAQISQNWKVFDTCLSAFFRSMRATAKAAGTRKEDSAMAIVKNLRHKPKANTNILDSYR